MTTPTIDARSAAWPRRWARAARTLLREMPWLLLRDPGLALQIARTAGHDPRDAALLPMLDRALRARHSLALVRRRAQVLESAGELTAAREGYRELVEAGDASLGGKVRWISGRLAEMETDWLPYVPGVSEMLEPVNRRRVLHIAKSSAPERWSGFTIRTLHNLRAQRDAGLEPVVATEIGWPRVAGVTDVAPVTTFEGFEHHRLDRGPGYALSQVPNDQRLIDTAHDMAPVVRHVRPAILHAHSGYRGGDHALVALALRERFGIPVVYEVRGLFEAAWSTNSALAERSELYALRLAQETRILREVDGVIAISGALADELASRGIPRDRITIVPNGIDAVALGAPARDPVLRRSLGLDGRFVVGYLGNLDHWREGIDVLISALAQLRAGGRRDVALLVVGDGTRRGALEAHARRMRVADTVRFTGRVPHESVAQYYVQMDLFANPRVDERAARLITPLKPFEAMALNVPVLVSDLPALAEIVDPPNRGAVAPPGDAAALAAVITDLADDPERRRDMAETARDWVRRERTWTANGPRYRAAYEAILGPLG